MKVALQVGSPCSLAGSVDKRKSGFVLGGARRLASARADRQVSQVRVLDGDRPRGWPPDEPGTPEVPQTESLFLLMPACSLVINPAEDLFSLNRKVSCLIRYF